MPSLKRTKEPEVFEFGKAVTTVISKVKDLHKQANELIDQVEYLKSRKKQEESDLERIIQEKADVLKLKQEVTDKIIAKKSEFLEFAGARQREIEAKDAEVSNKQAELTRTFEDSDNIIVQRQNELALRANELTKKETELGESVKQGLRADIQKIEEREREVTAQEADLEHETKALDASRQKFSEQVETLAKSDADVKVQAEELKQKKLELDVREKKIAENELKIADTRTGITQAVADLENQISIVKAERARNDGDRKAIEDMRLTLGKRKQELDNREIHINDRQATQLTH